MPDFLLLETGDADHLLLETGNDLLLESSPLPSLYMTTHLPRPTGYPLVPILNVGSKQAQGLLLWAPFSFSHPSLAYYRTSPDGTYAISYGGGAKLTADPEMGAVVTLTGSTSDYASFGSSTTLTGFTAFTMIADCLWVDFSGSFPFIAGRGLNSATLRDYIWYVHGGATQNMAVEIYNAPNSKDTLTSAVGSVVTAGRWYNCAMVAASGARLELYVGGKKIASSTPGAFTTPNLANQLILGRAGDAAFPMKGSLKNFRLYDRALSEGEIEEQADRRARADLLWAPNRRVYFYLAAPPSPRRVLVRQAVPRSSYY